MKPDNINQLLSHILPHDCNFYITNPEGSKDFRYNKKSSVQNNQSLSKRKQKYDESENASLDEIKSIIAERSGIIFLKALVLSGFITALLIITCFLLSTDWTVYAAFFIIFPSLAYLIYNVLHGSFYGIYLHYKLEGGKKIFHDRLLESFYELSYADKIWHVDSITPDKKKNNNGVSKEIYDRHTVKIKKYTPGFIKTNVNVWCLELKNSRLYFFPDYVIYEHRKRYSVMEYKSLTIEYIEKPYCETGDNPDDAVKIGTAWLHPKKDGSADLRFRNNPKISIMLYAEFKILSSSGHSFHFQISNLKIAYMFYRFISQQAMRHSGQRYKKPAGSKRKQKGQKTSHKDESRDEGKRSDVKTDPRSEIEKAYLLLGLKAGAPAAEIRAAYYLMAKKYHPDLVRNKKLIKEFDEKMKEINKAYDRLKQ